jgi:hypothetical protein
LGGDRSKDLCPKGVHGKHDLIWTLMEPPMVGVSDHRLNVVQMKP